VREMTTEETKVAEVLFSSAPVTESKSPRPRADRLVVRFDPQTLTLYPGDAVRRRYPLRGALVLQYKEGPARTPTGGVYTRRGLTVRTKDGKRWYGTVKNDTDVVKLRLAPIEVN